MTYIYLTCDVTPICAGMSLKGQEIKVNENQFFGTLLSNKTNVMLYMFHLYCQEYALTQCSYREINISRFQMVKLIKYI